MSVLSRETLAILKGVLPCAPLFSNMIAAELFDYEHTCGPLKVLPTVNGTFVVFDTRAPLNEGALEHHPTIALAHAALKRLAEEPPKQKKGKKPT